MQNWWAGLQPRERLILAAAGVVLVILAIYLLIWEPLAQQRASLQRSVSAKQAQLAWMREQAVTVRALRRAGATAGSLDKRRSLLAVVDQSLARAGLKGQLQRMEPDGADAVKLWFEGSDFDVLMRWLAQTRQQYGLRVGSLRIEPQDKPGLVGANLSLKRQAS